MDAREAYNESIAVMTVDELLDGIEDALRAYESGKFSHVDLERLVMAIEYRDGITVDDNYWDAYGWLQEYKSSLSRGE